MTTKTKRFQLDLSEPEHTEMERLMAKAGIKTKREFITQALTIFKWAANELANGRIVASMGSQGDSVRQLETPALQPFAQLGPEIEQNFPPMEEIQRKSKQPGIQPNEILALLKQYLEKANESAPVLTSSGNQPIVSEVV
jgi:hypothetical protein